MENTQSWVQNKGHGEKGSLSEEDSAPQLKKLVEMANSHQAIIQSQNSNGFLEGLFFLLVHGHYKIPRHIASADEIYVRHCLELAHISALKASQYSTPLRLQAKNIMLTSEESLNTLNSPLLQKFGASEKNDNLNRLNFTDAKNMLCYDLMDSPSGYSISSSPTVQNHNHGSIFSVHKGTNTTCFDCLNSASVILSKGMLQCTWKQGLPHFVFSADDQKEVYVAKLSKVDTTNDEALDYVYLFHKGCQKGHQISDTDLQLVGKMDVSTTFTLCPDNTTMMETQFVLFGDNKIHDEEMYTSSHSHWKPKVLCKKVSQVFRASPSSKFRGSSPIEESCTREKHSCGVGGINLLDKNVPPNFELAAIIVKEHVPSHKMDKVGGWGLKFLNKSGVNQTTLPCESYGRNNGDCSTSMSILIPAGLHGGPKTRHGGSSSLVDRWRSGGCCDCGGWDEGCPLTVLQRRSSNEEVLSQADMHGQCKSVDLVTQGSSSFSPTLRMVNIHEGLYFVHFQPTLSALQSFSIAVAIIHKQSPALWPNTAQKM